MIGIRAEDKNEWESRTPLTPADAQNLIEQGVSIVAQTSPQRAFTETEYEQSRVAVQPHLDNCDIILGLKEIPPDNLAPGKVYFIFSHVIKGQAYNMPMLKRMMELGITLVDYERIVDADNRRLIFFGRYAGIAGMLNSLWALGQRWALEGCANPFARLRQAKTYASLDQARKSLAAIADEIRQQGLPEAMVPLVVGFAGYGNVSQGAQEIFDLLPFEEIEPQDLNHWSSKGQAAQTVLYKVVFKEQDIVAPLDSAASFDLQDYYQHGKAKYRSRFDSYLPQLSMLINGNYWDEKFPRLLTLETCRKLWKDAQPPKLKVIGDISCDINGAIECTRKPAYPDNPVYVYEPATEQVIDGFAGHGPVVMAVEILPAELPRESSAYFSNILQRYIPQIDAADWKTDLATMELPQEIKTAVILHRGKLTPEYRYLQEYL
jgi:alpha-aminoadipic semialdehyde synthase